MKKIILIISIVILIIFLIGCNAKCNCNLKENCLEDVSLETIAPTTEPTPEPTAEPTEEPKYTNEELDLIARIIWCEAGSDWLTDEHQRAVASVVINRKNDSRFPNSIKGVIYQEGQYGCVYNGMINNTPNQRAYNNAKYVLDNGITIPSNVVWQSQSMQGEGLYKYIQGHYFCY